MELAVPEVVAGPRAVTERVDVVTVAGGARDDLVRLNGDPRVQVAELDHRIVASLGETQVGPLEAPDADPLFPLQWGLRNVGQAVGPSEATVVGRAGIDVGADEAWATTRGDDDVLVAVIDTAVDATHPDLHGAVVEEFSTLEGTDDGPAHGTGVASVLAARSSDGVGMAGVAPGISVVSIAAFTSTGSGGAGESTLAAVVAAFELAAELGADVINASWVTEQDSPLLRAAVAEAGVPVVAASGNDGFVLTPARSTYPAGYDLPNLVSVTAIDPSGQVPAFANVGGEVVDVAAPGTELVIAVPGGEYGWGDGTSFAAPHVSGALALAISAAPYATTLELVDAVSWTSRAHPGVDGVTVAGGILDAAALVEGVQRPVCRPDRTTPASLPDVAPRSVHSNGIDCVVGIGVAAGRVDGSYGPEALVTRGQMASFLHRVLRLAAEDLPVSPDRDTPGEPGGPALGDPDGSEERPATPSFPDVDRGGAHAEAIHRLAELGVVRGGVDGSFRPWQPVTRGQLASFLVRTYEHLTGASPSPSRRWFADIEGSTHAGAIDRARDLGLVRGVAGERFAPEELTRRDQMASVLAQLVDALAREGVITGW